MKNIRTLALLALGAGLADIAAAVLVSVLTGHDLAQLAVAIGLIVSVGALALLLGSSEGWKTSARGTSAVVAAAAIVAVGTIAIAAVTVLGANRNNAAPRSAIASTGASSSASEGAALISAKQSENNDNQDAHDLGSMPTFGQMMSMSDAQIIANSPAGTLTPDEVPVLKEQLKEARSAAENFDTVEKAEAAGYRNTTNDVPFMGAHFLNQQYLMDGKFDPAHPEGLLFSKLGGTKWTLVGVWYLIVPGVNHGVTVNTPPEGFAGNLDLWHQHYGLCTRNGIISENNTKASCDADHGNWVGDLRWMMHAWVVPETADNPNGVFAYLNNNLFRMQSVQAAPIGGPTVIQ
jgi:hypothetical protein